MELFCLLVDAKVQKICKECEGLGANEWVVAELADVLALHQEKTLEQLKGVAVQALEKLQPEIAHAYESYTKMQVRQSNQTLASFDKEKITESLVRETRLPRGVSEKIAREIEQELKSLNVKTVSSILIRELVNAKLVQYGFEDAKIKYSRVGLPVFDVQVLLSQAKSNPGVVKRLVSSAVMTQYTMLDLLPKNVAESHLSGNFFIGSLEEFPLKVFSAFSSKKDADLALLSSFSMHVCASQPEGQRFLDSFVVGVSSDFSNAGGANAHELKFKVSNGAFNRKSLKKLFEPNYFKAPVFAFLDGSGVPGPSEVFLREKKDEVFLLEKVSANLPKLALESKYSKALFYSRLEELAGMASQCLVVKQGALDGSMVSEYGLRPEAMNSVLSLHGLVDVSSKFSESAVSDDSTVQEALEVLDFFSKALSSDWLLSSSDHLLQSDPACRR
ncbi:MAG TPA: ATP cone domain-containing protein, partial [archaeon]|nr:ATP cone domain-containing protein [archaeon]